METVEAANDLLQNGILVETKNGLVCMSLKDALSSNLNLSAQDFQNVAQELILQQSTLTDTSPLGIDPVVKVEIEDVTDVNLVQQTSYSQPSLYKITNTLEQNPPATKISYIPITLKTSNDIEKDLPARDVSTETKPVFTQRRGGWPKGKKRKPELLYLPPKGAATGYNLFMNERRKQFGNGALPFHVITKLIGNEWSNLSLEEKKPYLERAEEDKRRYCDELKEYKRSGAYQLYLARKRRKRAQYNVLSESDMDATDDFDDEDNEELYCRICDQWFHNLHNKREHLQGRLHIQSVAGEITRELGSDYDTDHMGNTSSISFSTSLDESSLDAIPSTSESAESVSGSSTSTNIMDCMTNLISLVAKREHEVKMLNSRLSDTTCEHSTLVQILNSLKDREARLKADLARHKDEEKRIEQNLFQLWKVPSLFIVTNLESVTSESFEYSIISDIIP